MKYYEIDKDTNESKRISKKKAKERLATCYTEKVCTFDDMLATEGISI